MDQITGWGNLRTMNALSVRMGVKEQLFVGGGSSGLGSSLLNVI